MPALYDEGMPATVDEKIYNGRRILTVDRHLFDVEMARHGATTIDEVAALLEMDRRTVGRIRKGQMLPSNLFFAACVAAGINHMAFLRVEQRGPSVARAA